MAQASGKLPAPPSPEPPCCSCQLCASGPFHTHTTCTTHHNVPISVTGSPSHSPQELNTPLTPLTGVACLLPSHLVHQQAEISHHLDKGRRGMSEDHKKLAEWSMGASRAGGTGLLAPADPGQMRLTRVQSTIPYTLNPFQPHPAAPHVEESLTTKFQGWGLSREGANPSSLWCGTHEPHVQGLEG